MKTKPNCTSTKLNRRQFLRASAFAGSAFMVLPAGVVGLRAGTSPNGKLNVAGIGIGGQGASDLSNMESENIMALCDVDQQHAAHVFKKYPQAKQFTDYRKMLDEMKDIDGVVVATPDHLHAFVAIEAIKHGKHVYCEKPLTHSVWEAR
jgi:predicted dehydrogenase